MKNLELVHFMQESYRKVLDSMSRPTKVVQLDNLESPISFNFGSFVIMRILLDTETKFYLEGKNYLKDSERVEILTKAKASGLSTSDFIFVKEEEKEKLPIIIENSRKGTLVDPHLGATIVCEVDEIYLGKRYRVSGPGINGEEICSLPISEYWAHAREEAISDYPRGIDLIFVDKSGKIISIPRTTKITKEV
ncbi:MAG: phosphonate C-P lyase system protein PhnH [Sarcina sp.]